MNKDICPNCGHDVISSSLNGKNCVCLKCGYKWNWYDPTMNSKDEFNITHSCPKCGSPMKQPVSGYIKCPMCGYSTWNGSYKPKPDPNNPYTNFAKEMSLLHEALKAEGFKDAMVDILVKMVPIVWDKVELKRARKLNNVRRAARRYGRTVEEKIDETSAESFVREVNADNLLRNQESMDAIVKKGLGL